MKMQEEHLARRRRELIARSTAQRDALIKHGHSLSHSMSAADRAMGFLQRAKQHPGWILGLVTIGLIAFRPRRLTALLQGSIVALRTWRMLMPVV
jgi:hypothetical protein